MRKLNYRWVLGLCLVWCGLALHAQQGTGARVLFIGDSVTDGGWGNSAGEALPSSQRNLGDWNHLFGHGYMYLCAAHYMGHEPEKELQFYNRGIGGNTLQNLIDRWQEDCLDLYPDVLSVLVGTNDIHYWIDEAGEAEFDFQDWENRYRALVERTQAECPGVRMVLCTPFVVQAGWSGEAATFPRRETAVRRLAQIVMQIAEDNGLTCVRFDRVFETLPQLYPSIPLNHWSWDGIHPTPAGHQRMADEWIKQVNL